MDENYYNSIIITTLVVVAVVAKVARRWVRLRLSVLIPINVTDLGVFVCDSVCACSICSLTTPKHDMGG